MKFKLKAADKTIANICPEGSCISLYTQFELSFNKPRQCYYANSIGLSMFNGRFDVLFLASNYFEQKTQNRTLSGVFVSFE